eukprot:scaffold6710_cov117-Cylindrotheca_fusiformis.AAC.2
MAVQEDQATTAVATNAAAAVDDAVEDGWEMDDGDVVVGDDDFTLDEDVQTTPPQETAPVEDPAATDTPPTTTTDNATAAAAAPAAAAPAVKKNEILENMKGFASNLKMKTTTSPLGMSSPTTAEKSKQLLDQMKEKATSLKEKVMPPKLADDGKDAGDDPANEPRDILEKPKQMISEMKERANKALSASRAGASDGNGEVGKEKSDPLERSRQFFSDMKGKAASSMRILPVNNSNNAAKNSAADAPDNDAASADDTMESPKSERLEKSKQFFTGMKDKASSFKLKLSPSSVTSDRSPTLSFDKMKADLNNFAAGMKSRSSKPRLSASSSSSEPNAPTFTIGDDIDELLALTDNTANLVDNSSTSDDNSSKSGFSAKFNEMVRSVKSSTDSISGSMPSLASFGVPSDASMASSSARSTSKHSLLSEKISSFRSMHSIREHLQQHHRDATDSSADMDELDFTYPNERPRLIESLSPLFKPKDRSSEEHWNDGGQAANDKTPVRASRRASVEPAPTMVQLPPIRDDTTASSNSTTFS